MARAVALAAVVAAGLASAPAAADEEAAADGEGLRVASSLALRAAPVGVLLKTDAGYRLSLSDSSALLFDGTFFEPGVTAQVTPSSAWGGVYVDSLPLTVLQLRLSAQGVAYPGVWGYLLVPADATQPSQWSLGALGGGPTDGTSASGVMLEAVATPRARVGNTVFLAETKLRWVRMSVERPYYEPTFDMLLEPTDAYAVTRPTLGQVFVLPERDSWVMAALRWEHGRTSRSGVVRDMAAVVGLWKLPWTFAGADEMVLAVVGGYWARHPNRAGTVYAASQLAIEW